MPTRRCFSAALVAAALCLPGARAETPAKAQKEVDSLLDAIAGSGCEFYRNGSWHDSQAAVAHLRRKYKYLMDRDLVHSAEQFIDRAASESSFSGKPYRIRCAGAAPVTSAQWLHEKLAQLRAAS